MRTYALTSIAGALLLGSCAASAVAQHPAKETDARYRVAEVRFKSHDGHEMFGKLTSPRSDETRAIVICVQTAEGSTVDMKRPLSRTKTFNYYDVYRDELAERGVGFFSYEGRGIRMGKAMPRFESIDWPAFNTGTLDNKVKDVLSAIEAVREQDGCATLPILLLGASEGTLLAAEAASRAPKDVAGLVLYGVLATNLRQAFKYIMSDGAFLVYRTKFDSDKDGVISKAEFEKDPKKYRARVLRNAPFSVFDKNADGTFSADEMPLLTKVYLDAVDNDDYAVLQAWSKSSAGVSVPKDWFKDHFAHDPIWTFLAKLDIPVGCFHGAMDTNTPIAALRALEADAKKAGKTKMEFHYFDDLGHSMGIIDYFRKGKLPEGHVAMFAFVDRVVGGSSK